MQRPANYDTKRGNAILAYLKANKNTFVTAGQIVEDLRKERVDISRPTVYRQLERLIGEGVVRKYLLGGTSVLSFQYVDSDKHEPDRFRLKCDICDGIFNIRCGEVGHVSRHILESHEFKVDDTVFYGTCKTCRLNGIYEKSPTE